MLFRTRPRHAPFSEGRSPRQARRRRRRKYRYEVPSYRCHPFLAGRQNADLQIGYCSSVARGWRHVARATLQARQTGSGPQTLVFYICRSVIFFSCFFASGPCFGTWSVRIPSLKSAEIPSSLTSGEAETTAATPRSSVQKKNRFYPFLRAEFLLRPLR